MLSTFAICVRFKSPNRVIANQPFKTSEACVSCIDPQRERLLRRHDVSRVLPAGCNTPLVRNLDDQDFTVSSTWYSSRLFGGHRARLNLREWPSGWVASKEDKYPSLTIDLKTAHVINAIATQGYGRAPHWVTRYKILYKEIGDESGGFVYYRSRGDGFDKVCARGGGRGMVCKGIVSTLSNAHC